jgi:FkbH-like protein
LLALASKNDPAVVTSIWNELYGKLFPLSNFVSTKFSWSTKVESVAEILKETNLLPGNCLFVDDNPVERERIAAAFPEIKIIHGPIYTWRRILLWAQELQVPYLTTESSERTESIQRMIERETLKSHLDEKDYLRDLNVMVRLDYITENVHRSFPRAFELINKTNQFNTTGKRWTEQELGDYFASGGTLIAAHVSDRLTNYGLTAVMMVRANECSQIVMSCRVFGLGVERQLLREALSSESANGVAFRDTGKNRLCRTFLARLQLLVPAEQVDETMLIPIPHGYRLPDDVSAMAA